MSFGPERSAYPDDAVASYVAAPYIEAVADALDAAGCAVDDLEEWTIRLNDRVSLVWDEAGWELIYDDDVRLASMGGDPLASPDAVVAFVRAMLDDPETAPYPLDPAPDDVASGFEARLLAAYPLTPG